MLQRINGFNQNLLNNPETKAKPEKEEQNGDFVASLNGFMKEVNQLQKESGESVERLVSGDITNIHDVMVAVEKASVSFELMMEVRNKVIEAYHEVMRMQV